MGLVLGLSHCATFKSIDVTKAKSLSLSNGHPVLEVCGRPNADLPFVNVTLADGSVRSTELRKGESEDKLFDAEELVWTADIGKVELQGGPTPSAGISNGNLVLPINRVTKPNRFTWIPPADPAAVMDSDIHLSVSLKRNASVRTELTLSLTYACFAIFDFSGAAGAGGENGTDGTIAHDGVSAENGTDGSAGSPAASAGNVEGLVTVVQTTKHGPIGYAVFTRAADGARMETLFALGGRGVVVNASGGAGGNGGVPGNGGDGDQSQPNGSPATCGGSGGNGGYGGNAGNGGQLNVRYDRAHPEIQTLLRLSADAGRAGAGAKPGGEVGATFWSCPHPARPGNPGRDGRGGVAGRVSFNPASVTSMFPGGIKVGTAVATAAPQGSYVPPAGSANPGARAAAGPGAGPASEPSALPTVRSATAPPPKAAPAPASSAHRFKLENHSAMSFCTLQVGMVSGRQMTFDANLIRGKLAPHGQAIVSFSSATPAALRAISCDRLNAAVGVYKGSESTLTLKDTGGKPGGDGVMTLGKREELKHTPFEFQ